jgi:hypothetical protein
MEPPSNDDNIKKREEETLKRLLATPPQPKPKKVEGASPKKRGRPASVKVVEKDH